MTDHLIEQMTHDLRICEAGPRLLKSCEELLVVVDAAIVVISEHGDSEAVQTWIDALHKAGIAPGFGHRAHQVILDAEDGRT